MSRTLASRLGTAEAKIKAREWPAKTIASYEQGWRDLNLIYGDDDRNAEPPKLTLEEWQAEERADMEYLDELFADKGGEGGDGVEPPQSA
ncbi:hypothetical protein BH23PLA1_BH23PLA1_24500 [soil metagenome]